MQDHEVTYSGKELPSKVQIVIWVKEYLSSNHYKYLNDIAKYYDSENPHITAIVRDKQNRGKTPNNKICTGYYSTLVDSMAGYIGNNITYVDDKSSDIEESVSEDDKKQGASDFSKALNALYKEINGDYLDMQTMIRAVCFNKGCEIVYTEGDGTNKAKIKVASIDPRQMLFIYSDSIEPEIVYGIRIVKSCEKDFEYNIDFISATYWMAFKVNKRWEIFDNPEGINKPLLWDECPVIEYNTETINCHTAFHQVLGYIDALDVLITGNANEIDKLADALLKMSMVLSDEDKKNMSEWKVIQGMGKDDIAEYITRNTDPSFRDFHMKSLIQEIHKHAHVIDFYSADSGMTGDASGKALKTRLIDMNMFCDRIEKTIKLGWQKRNRLLKDIMIKDKRITESSRDEQVKVLFNRTKIVGVEDIAPGLVQATFLSDKTKQEACGLDPEEEEKRLEEQKANGDIDVTDLVSDKAPTGGKGEPIKASAPMSEPNMMNKGD